MPGDSRRNVGAANPRALAELRAGRKIDWSAADAKNTLSQLLDMKYDQLFDPKYGSPIYAGVPLDFSHQRCCVKVDPKTDIRKLFDSTPQAQKLVELGLVSNSVLQKPAINLRSFAAEAADQIGSDLQSLESQCHRAADTKQSARSSEISVAGRLTEISQATLIPVGQHIQKLDREFVIVLPSWLHLMLSDLNFGLAGRFFVDAPTATSPVQGALGDCWLIAAMASVAWTRPELISERLRREATVGAVDTGHADYRFDLTDVLVIPVLFFNLTVPFTFPIWIGEQVPQQAGGGYIYARSSVGGETWPAVLEKAVAVWRSGGNANFPDSADYGHINGGDAAWACHILTGSAAWYHWADADDSWSTIVSNCSGGRTTTPMVAWTWGSSDDSPDKVDYAGANLVADHAYSILGTWDVGQGKDARQYVVLRNPWGWCEGSLNVHTGAWSTQESWGTASLNLPGDGVFALEIHTFRQYFMGFGGAK
jgi:hypothetical protein